ncbi:hypothetical protein N177_3715 [Lutibaculum baratangense AMV1]|uniref:Uncharacterized protein n=1 Tax=Lutibaculum baratangense AMV1 TaxID=631454 RepID=V4RB01_9HYPH|nr:hypothetical protein N177_3715 [Lutibaculum baratangense AMV1]
MPRRGEAASSDLPRPPDDPGPDGADDPDAPPHRAPVL